MKWQHVLTVLLVIIAILFLWHNYMSHGGVAGVRQGLGFPGLGG